MHFSTSCRLWCAQPPLPLAHSRIVPVLVLLLDKLLFHMWHQCYYETDGIKWTEELLLAWNFNFIPFRLVIFLSHPSTGIEASDHFYTVTLGE